MLGVLAGAVIVLALLALVTSVVAWLRYRCLLDDAFMFVRYADNFLRGDGVRWNASDPPTWGLTSLLYLFVAVLPARFLFPHNEFLTLAVAGGLSGAAFLGLLAWLVVRHGRGGALPGTGRAWPLLVVVAYAVCLPSRPDPGVPSPIPPLGFTFHCVSGMDTTFVMAAVTLLLIVAKRFEGAGTRGAAVLCGVLGGGAAFVRPDLLAFGLALPGWMILQPPSPAHRSRALLALGCAAATAGAGLLAAALYFGTPLPLSFYAKSTGLYGPEFAELYRGVGLEQLRIFAGVYWLPLAALAVYLLAFPLDFWRRQGPTEKAALFAALVLGAYYALFVLQIMHFNQRFFFPTFPVLLYLGCRSVDALWRRWAALPHGLARWRRPAAALVLLALGAHAAQLWGRNVGRVQQVVARGELFELFPERDIPIYDVVFLTRELPDLPDDLVMAATEVGWLSVRADGKRLVDMAGLHDTEFATEGFSADRLLREDRPDLVYYPHWHYKRMNRALAGHPLFRRDYEPFTSERFPGMLWSLALRRDSPHYAALRAAVDAWIASHTGAGG